MGEKQKYDLLKIDADCCPETDEPIIKGQCTEACPSYEGFQLYNGLSCIKCSNCYDRK